MNENYSLCRIHCQYKIIFIYLIQIIKLIVFYNEYNIQKKNKKMSLG